MKAEKVLFFIPILFMLVLAIDDVSVTNTFQDSAIIEADDFNDNFDDLVNWSNAMIDTLDLRFTRFTDFPDSTLTKLNCDTIRSNPNIDSISGPTVIDTIRGNPDIDTITGNPYIDSIETDYADIDSGVIDGVVIGANSEEDATFDSTNHRVIVTDSITVDSLRLTGALTVSETITADSAILGGEDFAVKYDAAVPCSLFDGSTYRASSNGIAIVYGRITTLIIPVLSGTITAATSTYIHVPSAYLPSSGNQSAIPILIDNAGTHEIGTIENATTKFLIKDSNFSALGAGTGGLAASITVTYY